MSREEQKHFAVLVWDFALSVSIRSLPDGAEREALEAAKASPNHTNIRALLTVGQYRPWRQLIESALVEIGLAAVDEILEGRAS